METNFSEISELMSTDENLKPVIDLITQIMEIDDTQLNEQTVDVMKGMLTGSFTDAVTESAVAAVIEGFRKENLTRNDAKRSVQEVHEAFELLINELKPSKFKKQLLESVFDCFYNIFDTSLERYLSFDITLPIKLDEGAQVPTYAHETDAAADLYAAETVVLPAHSISTMIHTGVHIALPEGWMAMIFPRSSVGAKTGLRLSNSVGIIDSDYRGQLGILYDNISNSDYTINAGDRIAQLMIMPSYHFKANVVETIPTTDRGEGGFGSSGK